MIRRLVEVSYDEGFSSSTPEQIAFWLGELLTPELIEECVQRFTAEARQVAQSRPAIGAALVGNLDGVRDALAAEQARERELDRAYWEPLKAELEALRHQRIRDT
jgi:hypothetical protein